MNPAALSPHDPRWADDANALLARLRGAMSQLEGAAGAAFDHIGSTSVPGLASKPFLDLQVRITPLPADDSLAPLLAPLGLRRAHGSRPDSPGVDRDIPRGSEQAPDEVWEKSLWTNEPTTVILHVRRHESPWGRYTIRFRDWLRAHPERRDEYEAVKRRLSAAEEGKRDYDDYTRGKTAFFDTVQRFLE